MNTNLVVMPLDDTHDRAAFTCGNEQLDKYIKTIVSQDQAKMLGKCHVLVDPGNPSEILGFYTLSMHTIKTCEAPDALAKRVRYDHLPAILIGRLGVSANHQGLGLGKRLLAGAVKHCGRLATDAGAVAIVVDAIDDQAVTFYTRFGFKLFEDQERKLFLPLKGVVAELAREKAAEEKPAEEKPAENLRLSS